MIATYVVPLWAEKLKFGCRIAVCRKEKCFLNKDDQLIGLDQLFYSRQASKFPGCAASNRVTNELGRIAQERYFINWYAIRAIRFFGQRPPNFLGRIHLIWRRVLLFANRKTLLFYTGKGEYYETNWPAHIRPIEFYDRFPVYWVDTGANMGYYTK